MGLGTRLLRSVAEEAQRANVSTMTLKVSKLNPAAVDFYSHLGFHEVARKGENLELAIPIDRMLAPKV
jgi:ribosomal protein S18 acetylase RimI-like enzyme